MVIHHYKPECHVQKMGCYLQGQGHRNWVWVHTMKSWLFLLYVLNYWFKKNKKNLLFSFGDQLSLTVHVHKLKCLVKRLLCCIEGQSHSEDECLPGQYLWSVKLSMVMHHHQPEMHHHQPEYCTEISFCYVQGQSHNNFYQIFRSTETFATQISLMAHHHKAG